MKIIDWNAIWLSLVQFALGAFMWAVSSSEHSGYKIFGAFIALVGMLQTFQSLRGTRFTNDHILFYSYMLHRSIRLDQIKAANCEFGVRFSPMLLFGLAGGASRRGRNSSSMALRSYMVNLSGDFGTRQVRFYNKRWRDAFLMKLRESSPRCRITRWS